VAVAWRVVSLIPWISSYLYHEYVLYRYINPTVSGVAGEVTELREGGIFTSETYFEKGRNGHTVISGYTGYSLKNYMNKQYAKQIIRIHWTYPNPSWWVIPSAKTAAISTDLFDCLVFTDTRNRSGPLTSSVMTFSGSVDEDKRKTVPKSTWKSKSKLGWLQAVQQKGVFKYR